MIHLEETKRIESVFHNKFRQRPAWAIDLRGRAYDVE